MPMTCKICSSKKRAEIEQQILDRVPNTRIAAKYRMAERAVRNHKKNHMTKDIAAAQVNRGLTLFERFTQMWEDAVAEYDKADNSMAKAAWFREKRGLFEMAAKLGLQAQQERFEYRGCHPAIIAVIRNYLPEAEHYEA